MFHSIRMKLKWGIVFISVLCNICPFLNGLMNRSILDDKMQSIWCFWYQMEFPGSPTLFAFISAGGMCQAKGNFSNARLFRWPPFLDVIAWIFCCYSDWMVNGPFSFPGLLSESDFGAVFYFSSINLNIYFAVVLIGREYLLSLWSAHLTLHLLWFTSFLFEVR